jgi:Flp pilus assembly protein TadD
MLAMSERRWEVAARFLGMSVQIEPEDMKTHFLLAQTLLEENDAAGAETEIEKALELSPGRKELEALKTEIEARRAK